MNFITKFFKKRKQTKLYHQYIEEHKKNVLRAFYEMISCKDLQWLLFDEAILEPLWIRVLEHDDSKYDSEEFEPYRKHFFPVDEKEKEQSQAEFDKAWEHHWKNNDHHWQARVTWKDEDFSVETELACLENILDWMAMGYKFRDRAYQYYDKNKDKINLPQKQKAFMEKIMYEGVDKEYILKEQFKKMKEAKKDETI